MERFLKKPEPKRDEYGRFEQHGTGLIKKAQSGGSLAINKPKGKPRGKPFQPGQEAGPGRPKGSKNKTTLALKEAILRALDKLGGDDYLVRLGIENSSAYSSLLGKVLPLQHGIDAESNGGLGVKMVFERHIVWPDGRPEIEGVTPKALPAPDPTLDTSET